MVEVSISRDWDAVDNSVSDEDNQVTNLSSASTIITKEAISFVTEIHTENGVDISGDGYDITDDDTDSDLEILAWKPLPLRSSMQPLSKERKPVVSADRKLTKNKEDAIEEEVEEHETKHAEIKYS